MRLLYLTDFTDGLPPVDYLPDELYHGLVHLLGADNVIDYPPKPTYHSPESDGQICRYAFPNLHAGFDPIRRADDYDVIVISTPRPMAMGSWLSMRHLGKPIVTIDGQDDRGFTLEMLYDSILYFKREVTNPIQEIVERRYAPAGQTDDIEKFFMARDPAFLKDRNVNREIERKLRPISFSVEAELLDIREDKKCDLFFSGGRTHRHRRAALDHLRRLNRPGFDIVDGHVGTRRDYLRRLASARIGLSIQGTGFDCVRYWEIPAVGSLLLTERPTIAIHQNFQFPQQAFCFDRLDQIVPLVDQLLRNPALLESVTQAGRDHIRNHHTTTTRAAYVVAEIDRALPNRVS